jgi:hypothetical protein
LVFWYFGILVFWYFGILVFWYFGILVFCAHQYEILMFSLMPEFLTIRDQWRTTQASDIVKKLGIRRQLPCIGQTPTA